MQQKFIYKSVIWNLGLLKINYGFFGKPTQEPISLKVCICSGKNSRDTFTGIVIKAQR